jgi:hypothetical protein
VFSEEVIKAIIGVIGTLGVAAIGLAGVVISSRRPSKDKPPVGESKPLSEFNGTQNEFMALVIKDNSELREQLRQVIERVDSMQRHQDGFLGAVRRYLMKLATAWVGPDPMPWPDDADYHILEETLPGRSAGVTESKE